MGGGGGGGGGGSPAPVDPNPRIRSENDAAMAREEQRRLNLLSQRMPLQNKLITQQSAFDTAAEQAAQAAAQRATRGIGGGLSVLPFSENLTSVKSQLSPLSYTFQSGETGGLGDVHQKWVDLEKRLTDQEARDQSDFQKQLDQQRAGTREADLSKGYLASETARMQGVKSAMEKKIQAAKEAGSEKIPSGVAGLGVVKPKDMTLSQPLNSNTVVAGLRSIPGPSQTNKL